MLDTGYDVRSHEPQKQNRVCLRARFCGCARYFVLAGAATSDPDLVSFTITNRSRTRFGLKLATLTFPSNGHLEELDINLPNPDFLPGHSSVTCSDRIYRPYGPTHRWRLVVEFYVAATVDSPIYRARLHLCKWVRKRGWERIGEWILPTMPRWRYAYGPEMVGDRPAAPDAL